MKIAICFFGITRNLKIHTLESIERYLLNPVAERDPSFKKFGHFNRVPHVFNPRSGECNIAVDPDEYQILNCDVVAQTDQVWLDSQIDYEQIQRFGDAWKDDFYSLRNMVRQLYSLNQVTQLLLQSGQHFDLVIFSRADIRFLSTVQIPKISPRTLYTPWFAKGGGLNDRFAMGDWATMVKCGKRYPEMLEYCEDIGKPLHSERFLFWYTRKHRIHRADLMSIQFCRVRANGQIAPWDLIAENKLRYRLKKPVRILRNFVPVHWT